jgi:N6-adenosine-specific RNA methylase IME4
MLEREAKERQATSTGGTAPQLTEKAPQAKKGESRQKAAVLFQTNPHHVSDAKALKRDAPDLFDQVRVGQVSLKRAKTIAGNRKKKEQAQAYSEEVKNAPPLQKTYNVIYADPPWKYGPENPQGGTAIAHYATMELDEICDYPNAHNVKVADNAVLFLWVTNPFLRKALRVIESWGFEYKTNMVWVKTELQKPGSGYYVRGHHELLFIATRGSFTPLDKNIAPPISSVLAHPIGEHSQKPAAVYEIIERLYPHCVYLELFARDKRNGWDCLGADLVNV